MSYSLYYLPYHYDPFSRGMPSSFHWANTSYPSWPMQATPYREHNYFPPVDTKGFEQSAKQFQALMKQVDLFINKIVGSSEFAYQLMDAAQKSNQAKVEQLVKSVGITIKYEVRFTPTAIQIIFNNSTKDISCCSMLVGLRW